MPKSTLVAIEFTSNPHGVDGEEESGKEEDVGDGVVGEGHD